MSADWQPINRLINIYSTDVYVWDSVVPYAPAYVLIVLGSTRHLISHRIQRAGFWYLGIFKFFII
jgi:hypothetical protein